MIEPRHSRLSSLVKSSLTQNNLPTGSGFGGSSLKLDRSEELVFSIVTDSVSILEYTDPTSIEQPSPLVLEVGKIVIVAIWFWCLIGANFCYDSLSTILRYGSQEI
jgi:hypothetical protein